MPLGGRIAEQIEPTVNDLGFELVRVQLTGDAERCLQIMAEPVDGRTMTVDDCASISRALSAVLDVDDPIDGAYRLEVSSPGLDRPLVRLKDYTKFQGFEAKIELHTPIDGRKRFRGILGTPENSTINLLFEGQDLSFEFDDIYRAKLILTDELIKAFEEQKIK